MATWSTGDGSYLDENYGGYGIPSADAGENYYSQFPGAFDPSSQETQVPLFGSGAYYNNTGGYLIPANQSLAYTNASDYLGAVPNYGGAQSSAEFENGGISAMGSLAGGLGGAATGLTMGNAIGGAGALVGAYEGASTDTGTSVLSGAVSGAAAGTMIMPGIGTAIGAVVGGLAGFFGSKNKKSQEKKAFQQQEELAIAPQKQAQANWLQQEGLKQQAISNYGSGYTPGGFQYKNGLLGNATNRNFGVPTANPTLPNFNQAPPDVTSGGGNKSLGINGNNVPSNNVNLNPSSAASHGLVSNFTGAQNIGFAAPTATAAPTAPAYSSNSATNNANLAQYQKDYATYLQNQNSQYQGAALNGYNQFYGG